MTAAIVSLSRARERLHVSASAVSTLQECPRRFWYHYVVGAEEEHVASSLVLGKAVHRALALHYRSLRDEERTPELNELVSIAGSVIVQAAASSPGVLYREGEDAGSLVEQASRMLTVFRDEGYRPVRVLAVELPFSTPLVHPRTGEVLAYDEHIVGAIDLVAEEAGGEVVVVDHKTVARSDAQRAHRVDVQMAVYSGVAKAHFAAESVRLRYQQLVKTKVAKVEMLEVKGEANDVAQSMEAVASAIEFIQVAVAHPRGKLLMGRRRSWKCRDCPSRRRCEGDQW